MLQAPTGAQPSPLHWEEKKLSTLGQIPVYAPDYWPCFMKVEVLTSRVLSVKSVLPGLFRKVSELDVIVLFICLV